MGCSAGKPGDTDGGWGLEVAFISLPSPPPSPTAGRWPDRMPSPRKGFSALAGVPAGVAGVAGAAAAAAPVSSAPSRSGNTGARHTGHLVLPRNIQVCKHLRRMMWPHASRFARSTDWGPTCPGSGSSVRHMTQSASVPSSASISARVASGSSSCNAEVTRRCCACSTMRRRIVVKHVQSKRMMCGGTP